MSRMRTESYTAVLVTISLSVGAIFIAACSPPATDEMPDMTGVTVFEGARVIVGDGSAPIEDATFIVDGTNFVQVGNAGDVEVPEGAVRVDLTGQTVIPALVDTHTHMGRVREALIDDLYKRAYYGVGAALSLGHGFEGDLPFEVTAEMIPEAALYRTAGRGITMPEPGRADFPYWVTSEEEAREAVRELAASNVDIVKIWVDDRNGMYEKLTPELYGAIIDEAHQHGLRVAAHIFTLEDAKGLLRAGVDAFAHGVRDMDIDDEFVDLIQERPDVVLIPNLPNRGVATDLSWLSGTVAADDLQELQAASVDQPDAQQSFAIQARNLDKLNEVGMRIVFGTDGNAGWRPHVEMEDMVAAGMTADEVIIAATSSSADFLGLVNTGTVEAGKSADFVVLEANPLDDITNTRQITSVYLRGEEVDRSAMSERWISQSAQ